jgi:hypothetical protein
MTVELFPALIRCGVCRGTYRAAPGSPCPLCLDREVRARTAASVVPPKPAPKLKVHGYDQCTAIRPNGLRCRAPADAQGRCGWHREKGERQA